MTKTEFVAQMAESHDFSRQEAEKVINAFLDAVEDGLCRDGKIVFRNFGTFEVAAREGRRCINPHTGEAMEVPPTKTVVFRAGLNLKEGVDSK